MTADMISYEEVFHYLEEAFLPAVTNSSTPSGAAVPATPLRQKAVGAADLTLQTFKGQQQRQQQEQQQEQQQQDAVENSLLELSSTLISQLEALLEQDDSTSVVVHGKTAAALLQILNQCMEAIISLTSSRQMVCFHY
jgi:hypothetical protein